MPKRSKEQRNLLDLAPSRVRQSETDPGDREVVLVPRFGDKTRLSRWLQRRAQRPFHRVTLDEYGTFIWRRIDGATPVLSIAEALKQQYGEKVEPVYQRVGMFINQMARAGFISLPKEQGRGSRAHG